MRKGNAVFSGEHGSKVVFSLPEIIPRNRNKEKYINSSIGVVCATPTRIDPVLTGDSATVERPGKL